MVGRRAALGLVAVLCATSASWGQLMSFDLGASGGVTAGVFSNYVFRGQDVADFGLGAHAEANWEVPLTKFVFRFMADEYYQLADTAKQAWFDAGAAVGYRPVPGVELQGGYIYYDRVGVPNTQEVFAGIRLPIIPSAPTLRAYFDIDSNVGTALRANAGYSFAIPRTRVNFDLAGELGLDVGRIGEISDFMVRTGFSYKMRDNFRARAAVDTWIVNNQVQADNFQMVPWAGFSYGWDL